MKRIKVLTGILFVIGLFLILGEAGRSDMLMELHQEYHMNYLKIIFGILMMLPLPHVLNKEGGK